jgi:benzoate/toluate 1,2-dioxygenase alpha subunit
MGSQEHLTDLQTLVQPTRVHRSVYTDPDIFALEMERIWGRAWIYVGHESQVPSAGSFITTEIGLDPVLMVRDDDDNIRVLFNRCRHKGAKLSARCVGKTDYFRCPYHGWTYRNNGELRGVPAREGYPETGFNAGDHGLVALAQVDNIRGFVFATKSPSSPDLRTYLGDAAATLENIADRAPAGKVEIAGGRLRYRHPCNWKMFIENLNDAMHPMIAHSSVGMAARSYMKSQPEGTSYPREAEILFPFGSSYDFFDQMGVTGLANGHGYMGGTSSIHTAYSDIPGYWEAMVSSYGEIRTQEILSSNRHNTIFYPSFTAKDAIQAIRVARPRSVNETIIETYHFKLVGAPEEMLERTILYSRLINSSSGMVGPDDLDCYARMQEALCSSGSDWVDLSRYAQQDNQENGNVTGSGTSDLAARNQFSAWSKLMATSD